MVRELSCSIMKKFPAESLCQESTREGAALVIPVTVSARVANFCPTAVGLGLRGSGRFRALKFRI